MFGVALSESRSGPLQRIYRKGADEDSSDENRASHNREENGNPGLAESGSAASAESEPVTTQ